MLTFTGTFSLWSFREQINFMVTNEFENKGKIQQKFKVKVPTKIQSKVIDICLCSSLRCSL